MRQTILDLGKRKARERGGILVIAIIVILAMLILAIPFLFKLSASNRSTERAARALSALNLAEAGVDKVVWDINQDPASSYDPLKDDGRINWNLNKTIGTIDNIKTPDNSVSGNVAITLGVDPDPSGMTPSVTRPLESTGLVPFIADRTVDRTVRVVLEKHFESIFGYGFVVDEYFRINNTQLTVDSYDSRLANYDPRDPGDLGLFSINSQIPNSFIVDQGGGGTVNVTGAIAAGGDALTEIPATIPTDALADSIVDFPKQIDSDVPQIPMESPFVFPEVDLLTLRPKATWPAAPDISSWFGNTYVDGTELPTWSQVNAGFKGTSAAAGKTLNVSGSASLDESANGIYTSFVLADGATLSVEPNEHVAIMVSEFADSPNKVAHFIMGQAASFNIGEEATLTLILGQTSFYMGHQSTINVPSVGSTDEPGTPGDCLILGMNAFVPDPPLVGDLSKKQGLDIQKDPTLSPVGTVVFEQQVDISAAIYTPLAQVFDILGMNHADIYGAWITNSMIFKVAAGFHYDAALGDSVPFEGGLPKWRILNWQEKVGN